MNASSGVTNATWRCRVNKELELVPKAQPLDVRRDEPQDLLAMAVKQGASVDTLERLMVVRKELRAEEAEADFNSAMSAFQSECPIIIRNRDGHENRYRYAPLELIVQKVTPYLAKHGFHHQEDGIVTEGWVEALVIVTHRSGHSITRRFKVPAESRAGMSPAQKYGAAMTFATRYAFCAALGIRTAERDTDCPPGADKTVTELKAELWSLLKGVRGTEQNWKQAQQWLWDECVMDPDHRISNLAVEDFQSVIAKAKGKLGL